MNVHDADPGPPDVGRRLLAFNWLPAGYAHDDWLGPWSPLLDPRSQASLRLLGRVSLALLERYELKERHLRDLGDHVWLLNTHKDILRLADEIGTAMLGGWVQQRIERRAVEDQTRSLGVERRHRALQHAQTLRALPKGHRAGARGANGWPIAVEGLVGVYRLGVSCLAALLDDPQDGARERFTLRFAAGTVEPLFLEPAQRDEALALIHGVLDQEIGK